MDETAIAFEPPHVRASATHAGPPLDRISVRDYVRQVEIGAFRPERGVTQRVRFNVVLEVSHHTAAQDDDVDKVISYDTITEAIEHELAAERINLLETLAERVAARCLADPRAVRAFVRIEKLDRIPGTLGVEIVRTRLGDEARRLRPVELRPPPRRCCGRASSISPRSWPRARDWRDALGGLGPAVRRSASRPPCRSPPPAARGSGGSAFSPSSRRPGPSRTLDPRFSVVGTRTELDWAMKSGRLSVWAPAHMASAAVGQPVADASEPVALAAWLAETLGAGLLVVAGAPQPEGSGLAIRPVARPRDLRGPRIGRLP